jgi:RimJ/RimL family protein N-acetyltransferase
MPEPVPIGSLLQRLTGNHRARPWRNSDASELVAAWNDPEIIRWNGVPPDPSLAFAERWIAGTATQHIRSPHVDVVVANQQDRVEGELGLQLDHATSRAEVGFWVAAHARRAGVGMELLELAHQLLRALEIKQGFAITASDNAGAIALLQRTEWPEVATTTSDRRAFLLQPELTA